MEHLDWQINKSSAECNKYILENEVDCDVSFKVGEDQMVIKAHKFILRMRSPVFDRMFNGCFQESESDPVIPDISPEAFRTLLRYCYYDYLDIEGDVALTLLYAATKYMLPILETAARKTLIETLNSSKIWNACKYSTDVGDKELHQGCISYLKGSLSSSNILDVIKYAATTGHEELRACCKNNLNKHLSGSNVWEVYQYALKDGDTEVHQDCKKYFQRDVATVREALESVEFLIISIELLSDLLHINGNNDDAKGVHYVTNENIGISISDIELFKVCNTWAEAKCLRQKIDPTGANKRTVLGECLSLIRFPDMLQKDLMTVVFPTCILAQAEIAKLGLYIVRDPGTECQIDFPSGKRQFVVTPSGSGVGGTLTSTVFIESDIRVMLSRLWTWYTGSYRVTVRDEGSQRSWSIELDAKHENHSDDMRVTSIINYVEIEPQVLEAGTRYAVTAECTTGAKFTTTQPGVEYIRVPGMLHPYKEMKVARGPKTNSIIYGLTMSLV